MAPPWAVEGRHVMFGISMVGCNISSVCLNRDWDPPLFCVCRFSLPRRSRQVSKANRLLNMWESPFTSHGWTCIFQGQSRGRRLRPSALRQAMFTSCCRGPLLECPFCLIRADPPDAPVCSAEEPFDPLHPWAGSAIPGHHVPASSSDLGGGVRPLMIHHSFIPLSD